MFLGVFFGLILSPSAFALVPKEIAFGIAPWVALAGNLFLALIKMVIYSSCDGFYYFRND